MAIVTTKELLASDPARVWDIVTSLEDVAWRSDISRVQTLSQTQFVEYTKEGFATTFTITACEPCRRWAFDMENKHIRGHWTGVFTPKGDQTEVAFTEDVTARHLLMKPFVKSYLKKQQAQYLHDLRLALSR